MNIFNKEIVFIRGNDEEKNAKKLEKKAKKEEIKRLNFENAEINKFYNRWVEVMAYIGLKNEMFQTFALRSIKYESYGFSANIHAPLGMTLLELQSDKIVGIIQDNLQCTFIFDKVPKSNHMKAKFICKDVNFTDYAPIKLQPYEVLISQNIDGNPMTANMLKYPHILVQGSTNMGKTKFIDIILTNLITTTSQNDLNFYIVQADKNDQYVYSGCKHCKGYTEDIIQTLLMLMKIVEIIEERNNALKEYNYNGICNNIKEYNDSIMKKIIKNKPTWSYNYLVIDEYASLMPEGDFGDSKKIKQQIQALMERIIQIGRFVGFYCILSTQRSTIDKLPSFVKSNCATVVTFKVNNRKSSEIAIDSGEAVNLKLREFITKIDVMSFGQTYNLSTTDIVRYIKPFRYSQPQKFDFAKGKENVIDDIKNEDKKKGKRKTKAERKAAKKEREEMETKVQQTELEELRKYKEQLEKEKNNTKNNELEDIEIKEKKDKVKFDL